jgi:GTP-binding protein LepA
VSNTHIRNFSIIAHIDHGKTTLTDRLLQFTHTVPEREQKERIMDSNPIEQERGITIKLAPVKMKYTSPVLPTAENKAQGAGDGQEYIYNLIDTPGHVDFGYEVSRSLAACEGALLVVDATQGVQAQTLSNYEKAKELGLDIIPVINKIDLPSADIDAVSLELIEIFQIPESSIVAVSAKTGQGIDEILEKIRTHIRPPEGKRENPLRALVFTSQFDQHKGVIAYIKVVDGVLEKNKLKLMATNTEFLPGEIGVFSPMMMPIETLSAGEVGYILYWIKRCQQSYCR